MESRGGEETVNYTEGRYCRRTDQAAAVRVALLVSQRWGLFP